MSNGELAAILVGAICGFGSGVLFYGIGAFGAGQKKPMNFWAGQTLVPESVTDIPAYNHACARLWKRFSIPAGCLASCPCCFLLEIGRRLWDW